MADKEKGGRIQKAIKPKKAATVSTKKTTKKVKSDNSNIDSSKQVAIDVRKLTEQDAENMLDKIIDSSKKKKTVNSKFHINSKFYQSSNIDKNSSSAAARLTRKEKREADRLRKIDEKARLLKKEANRQAIELKKAAERHAEEIKLAAKQQAADIKMIANVKASKLKHKTNKKAVKRELKAQIKQARLDAAVKLGKAPKLQSHNKLNKTNYSKSSVIKLENKFDFTRIIRNTIISCSVVAILVIGGGFAYTWYIGQGAPVEASKESSSDALIEKQSITPTKPAANAKVGVSIQMLTSPVSRGSTAMITVKTLADSMCSITVKYNDISVRDPGLLNRQADDYGVVSWNWTVDDSIPDGKWPVEVICSRNNSNGMVRGELIVGR